VSCAQGKRQARVARRAMAPGEQWAERALRRAATLREVVGHGEERIFFLEILEFCCCKSFFRKTFYPKSFMFVDKIFLKRNLTNVFINLVFQKSFSFC
jgi:hypothetical protein